MSPLFRSGDDPLSTFLGVVGGVVAAVASAIAIREQLKVSGKITVPGTSAECGGRVITVAGAMSGRRGTSEFWLAVQPSDCRGAGLWWPQGKTLRLSSSGYWQAQCRLGRDGADGESDVGKSFTVALVRVLSKSQVLFSEAATADREIPMPASCRVLDTVEIRRVRY